MKRVTINGFSVMNCRTMEGSDGYVLSCDLCLNGKKLVNCFDGGYGAEMEFTPYVRFDFGKLEKLVSTFREPETYEGHVFPYSVTSLVCNLMDYADHIKEYRRISKAGHNLAIIKYDNGLISQVTLSKRCTLEDLNKWLEKNKKHEVRKIDFIDSEEHYDVNDITVTLSDIC